MLCKFQALTFTYFSFRFHYIPTFEKLKTRVCNYNLYQIYIKCSRANYLIFLYLNVRTKRTIKKLS